MLCFAFQVTYCVFFLIWKIRIGTPSSSQPCYDGWENAYVNTVLKWVLVKRCILTIWYIERHNICIHTVFSLPPVALLEYLFLLPEAHLMVSSLYCPFQGPQYVRLGDFSRWRPRSQASLPLEEEGKKFVLVVTFHTTNMEKKCCLWPHTHNLASLVNILPFQSVSETVVLLSDRYSFHATRDFGIFQTGAILHWVRFLAKGRESIFSCSAVHWSIVMWLKAELQVIQTQVQIWASLLTSFVLVFLATWNHSFLAYRIGITVTLYIVRIPSDSLYTRWI